MRNVFGIKLFLFSMALPLSLVMLINYLVNPYGITEETLLVNNPWKPAQSLKTRHAKALTVSLRAPDAVILGNSRSEYGLSPNHAFFSGYNTYNLAFSSQSLLESFIYLKHADIVGSLRKAVISLDFDAFGTSKQSDFNADVICSEQDGCWPTAIVFQNFASLEMLSASLETLLNTAPTRFHHLPNGMRDPYHNSYFVEKEGGYYQAFAGFENHVIKNFSGGKAKVSSAAMVVFHDMLEWLHANRIDTEFIISPSHARKWELLDFTKENGFDTWEQWKRALVRANEVVASSAGHEPFRLWDFSGYHMYATERVPAQDEKDTEMDYHWDTSHYKKELGDMVLDRLMGAEHGAKFGIRLESAMIEEHLLGIRKSRNAWREMSGDQVERFVKVDALSSVPADALALDVTVKRASYHHMKESAGGELLVDGANPFVVFRASRELNGSNVRIVAFEFICIGQEELPELKLYWHDSSRAWFDEDNSVKLESGGGNVVFDMHSLSDNWMNSQNIKALRVDVANPSACSAILFKDLRFLKDAR